VDIIYLDANHSYSHAAKDIEIADSLLAENGLLILDDVGPVVSPQLCTEQRGGVRQALIDYAERNRHLQVMFLEPPFWLNPCGIAMVCKQSVLSNGQAVQTSSQASSSTGSAAGRTTTGGE
jgi:hypothetical protein